MSLDHDEDIVLGKLANITEDTKIVRDIIANHLDNLRRFSRTILDLTVAT